MAKTTWAIDPLHSEFGFKIRHLMISNVSGIFGKFQVTAETENDDFLTAKIKATLDPASITAVESKDEENFTLRGNLTLRGITKPVMLNVEFSGVIAKDPWGLQRAGFTVSGKINRNDFGLSFNSILDTGGVALGDEVKLQGEIQLVKETAAVAAA